MNQDVTNDMNGVVKHVPSTLLPFTSPFLALVSENPILNISASNSSLTGTGTAEGWSGWGWGCGCG